MKHLKSLLYCGLACSFAQLVGEVFAQSDDDLRSGLTPIVQVAEDPRDLLPSLARVVGDRGNSLPPILPASSQESSDNDSAADPNSASDAPRSLGNQFTFSNEGNQDDSREDRVVHLGSFFRNSNATAKLLMPVAEPSQLKWRPLAPVVQRGDLQQDAARSIAGSERRIDAPWSQASDRNSAHLLVPRLEQSEPAEAKNAFEAADKTALSNIESSATELIPEPGRSGVALENASADYPESQSQVQASIEFSPLKPLSQSNAPSDVTPIAVDQVASGQSDFESSIIRTDTPHAFQPFNRATPVKVESATEQTARQITQQIETTSLEPNAAQAAAEIARQGALVAPPEVSPAGSGNLLASPSEFGASQIDTEIPEQPAEKAQGTTVGEGDAVGTTSPPYNLVQYQATTPDDPSSPRIVRGSSILTVPTQGELSIGLGDEQPPALPISEVVGAAPNGQVEPAGSPLPVATQEMMPETVQIIPPPWGTPQEGIILSESGTAYPSTQQPLTVESGFNAQGQCAFCGGAGCEHCTGASSIIADDSAVAAPMSEPVAAVTDECCGFMIPFRNYLIVDFLDYDRSDDTVFGGNFINFSDFDDSKGGRIIIGSRSDATIGDEISYMGFEGWTSVTTRTDAAGGLFANVVAGPGLPLGALSTFSNDVFLQQVQTSDLQSLEINRTHWGWDVVKTTLGIRAILFDDDYQLSTEDLMANQGLYTIDISNRMFGPQLGCELFYDVGYRWSFSFIGKIAAYANIHEGQTTIFNDGTLVLNSSDKDTSFAASFEFGIHAHYQILPDLRARAGIDLLGLWDVSTASTNFHSVITPTTGFNYDHGDTAAFGGPFVGLEYYW